MPNRGFLTARDANVGDFAHPAWGLAFALAAVSVLQAAALQGQQAPVVDSFTAAPSTFVTPGTPVSLTVQAHDPDCPSGGCTSGCGAYVRQDLTQWVATGGVFGSIDRGASGSPYTTTAVWQAPSPVSPDPQTFTISVTLSDSGTSFCGNPRQTSTANLLITVGTSPNQPPVVSSVTALPAQAFPGQTSDLTCTASDPDGDTLTYSWSADAGTVTPGSGSTATYSSPAVAIATITCTATDSKGGSDSESVSVAVTEAKPDGQIVAGLVTPQRLGIDRWGGVYVADRGAGGIVVVHLGGGELLYRLPMPDVTAVAVDWNDRLVVGRSGGAELRERDGTLVRAFAGTPGLGEVADVAVDGANRRYGVLYRRSARIELFNAGGTLLGAFGTPGDNPSDLRTPSGLAFDAAGNVVVADQGHGQLKVFTAAGVLLHTLAGPGSGVGEFSALDDVDVAPSGSLLASDAFESWVQSLDPVTGAPREVLGAFGSGPGMLKTPAGVLVATAFGRVLAASVNTSSVQVFRLSDNPPAPPEPGASIAPARLSFPDQAVGTTSTAAAVTLSNPGAAPLGILGVVTTGEFAARGGCGPFLPPGGRCALAVTFAPAGVGRRDGTLTTLVSTGTPLQVALTGSGFTPATLVASPRALAFANQRVLTTSDPQPVRLTNVGSQPLAIAAISTSGDFVQSNDCGAGLAGGASCTVLVSFAPQAIAQKLLGTLTVAASSQAGPLSLPLSGGGVGSALSASPGVLTFAATAPGETGSSETVTLVNTGTHEARIAALALGGAHPDSWLLQEDRCSDRVLGAGASCTVGVAFRPAIAGPLEAALEVQTDADLRPSDVLLAGGEDQQEAIAAPILAGGGVAAFAVAVAALGAAFARRRPRSKRLLMLLVLLFAAPAAWAQTPDPPRWSSQSAANPGGAVINCSTSRFSSGLGCHQGHGVLGSALTNQAGNANVCQQCHSAGQIASALAVENAHKAVPGVSGSSHAFDVPAVKAACGASTPAHNGMAARLASGNITCSTCHNQHAASAADGGSPRIGSASKTTAGASPIIVTGGTYTGAGGLWYLLEITGAGTQATARYRYSKDGGLTWTPSANCTPGGAVGGCLTAAPSATALDNGVTVAFPAGSYSLGEKYEFSASWPFLRTALDSGANGSSASYCRDCHSAWTMSTNAAHTYTGGTLGHPVGVALAGAAMRATPLDVDGAPQGASGDANPGNDLRTDSGGVIQCWSCHAAHFAPSNSAAVIP